MTLRPHQYESCIQIDEAIFLLNSGQPVAIPTETVYGLASKIDSAYGLEQIFKIKARPFFDPLIVHVSSIDQAKSLSLNWNCIADSLSSHFWPGPLTLVLEKSNKVNDLITSGLTSVGIRMPNHPIALKLISACGPLAAPSANKYGRTSPTRATHILEEYQGCIPVVDGGPCEIGIESTIIKVHSDREISILRPGMISQMQVELALSRAGITCSWINSKKEISPGSMKHHYMPSIPLIITLKQKTDHDIIMNYLSEVAHLPNQVEGVTIHKPQNINKIYRLLLPDTPQMAARELYALLRHTPKDADLIVIHWSHSPSDQAWSSIWDRLKRAATLIL